MQKFIYVLAAIFIAVGIALLTFSHNGLDAHIQSNLISLGPINFGGPSSEIRTSLSSTYGWISIALGLGLAIFNFFKR